MEVFEAKRSGQAELLGIPPRAGETTGFEKPGEYPPGDPRNIVATVCKKTDFDRIFGKGEWGRVGDDPKQRLISLEEAAVLLSAGKRIFAIKSGCDYCFCSRTVCNSSVLAEQKLRRKGSKGERLTRFWQRSRTKSNTLQLNLFQQR